MLAAQRRGPAARPAPRDGRVVAKDLATELGLSEDSCAGTCATSPPPGCANGCTAGPCPPPPALADYRGPAGGRAGQQAAGGGDAAAG